MALQDNLKPITADEYWELAQFPAYLDKRLELDEGVLVEMPPSSPINSYLAGLIVYFLNAYLLEHPIGYVFGADGGYTLAPRIVRIPDASYISKARLPALPKPIDGAPDLVVEVISETEQHVMRKVRQYISAGAQVVWLVYPEEKIVEVCTPTHSGILVQTKTVEDALEGEALLPDFILPIARLFGQP